ncbi:DUF6538 domain-containing protein [Inquilinus sp. OTU3971]|uniref:DUF6538 domain-containing protein n=1 Tax=Inquilinus sp. OTU3971 TaxID=3043855 RepID=UPI00313DBE65
MADLRFLLQRRQTWYLRMTVPSQVRKAEGRAEWVISLKTRDLSIAQRERWAWVSALQARWADMEAGRSVPAKPSRGTAAVPPGASPSAIYQETLRWAREAFPETEGSGGGPDDLDDPSEAGLELEAEPLVERLQREEFEGVPANLTVEEEARLAALSARLTELRHGEPATPPAQFMPAVSELAKAYHQERQRDPRNALKGQTVGQEEAVFRLFSSFWGDKPLARVRPRDAVQFFDKVARLDPHWGRSPDTKERSFTELLRLHGEGPKGLSNKTINRYVSSLTGLWDWAKKREAVAGVNPFEDQFRKVVKSQKTQRIAFAPDNVTAILRASGKGRQDLYRRPMWWVTRIALFTGMRLNEICSLDREDVRQEHGVWVFDITEAKSEAGVRVVPIHSELIRLGLLDHLPETGPIFPELAPAGPDKKRSWYLSRAFTVLRRSVGAVQLDPRTGEDRLVFHSFRRNVITCLDRARIPDGEIAQVVGHEKKSFTLATYSDGHLLRHLRDEVVQKIAYPDVPTDALEEGKPEPGKIRPRLRRRDGEEGTQRAS